MVHRSTTLLVTSLLVMSCSVKSATFTGGDDEPGDDAGAGSDDGGSAGHVIFVAQGHAGRTTVSCDGGRTWKADRSDSTAVRCFDPGNPTDCDHNPGAGRGIGYADGRFYATFGWGTPGDVRISDDGVNWTSALAGTSFGGVAVGRDWIMGGRPSPSVSFDRGATWMTSAASPMLSVYNVRRTAMVDVGGANGQRAIMIGNDGSTRDAAISADGGASWTHPVLGACAEGDLQSGGGIVAGNGIIVIASAQATGTACRSSDGGVTFTSHAMGGAVESQLVWTGTEFLTWGADFVLRSPNGINWSRTPVTAGLQLGAMAAHDGTIVAVRGAWQTWYEQQKFYRSTDGVTWETLAPSAYAGSHPITHVAVGHVAASSACL